MNSRCLPPSWWKMLVAVAWLGLSGLNTGPLVAQDPSNLQLPGQLGVPGFGDDGFGAKVEFAARLEAQNGGPDGKLVVTAKIQDQWHLYSLTQKPGGPLKTKFELVSEPAVKPGGAFKPDKAPVVHRYEDIWAGLDVEEHVGTVVWRNTATLPGGVDPASFQLSLKVTGQVCQDSGACIPVKQVVPVKLVGFASGAVRGDEGSNATSGEKPAAKAAGGANEKPFALGPYRGQLTHVNWTGKVRWQPDGAKGSAFELEMTATLDDKYHVYAWSAKPGTDSEVGSKPTLFALTNPSGWRAGDAATNDTLIVHESGGEKQEYHERKVTWTIPITASDASSQELRGIVGFQTCTDTNCDRPSGAEFSVALPDVQQLPKGEAELQFRSASYTSAINAVLGKVKPAAAAAAPTSTPSSGSTRKWTVQEYGSTMNLWTALGLAMVGGFLLNFMPCVLPVIGLKIVAFIQQSQGSRREALLLNVFYAVGIIAVFLVLASFAAVPQWFGRENQLGWGEQFQSTAFNMVMASIVFVFALSMLGVWEIPVPSFLGAGKAAGLANQSGYFGAFAKGIFTTLLATPCTGPFMGSALTWAFKQTPLVIFVTFFALGLGMSLPYLVIGAFPRLMRFLPKPGAWMDTFKQVMGFVMLATVVFIFSFLNKDMIVPTFGILVGLWIACWWIGRTPVYSAWQEKFRAWAVAVVMATLVGWGSYELFAPKKALLPWTAFSRVAIEESIDQGKTVLVDFTADWCLTCKANEKFALNTKRTLSVVETNAVVVVKADMTNDEDPRADEITQLLHDVGHSDLSIPFLVIFPGDGSQPIAFSGPVSTGTIVAALHQAGPSRSSGQEVARVD